MDKKRIRELELQAVKIRKTSLQAIRTANSGHIGGSFSIAELMSVLYFEKMHVNARDPGMQDRDRFILSKGHCCPAVYAALAYRGYFPLEDMKGFRRIDGFLSGHMEMNHIPGVDMSTGSLGQGLSAGAGMALSAKCSHETYRVFVVIGDGEMEEGQIWEAAMAAGNYGLDHLICFVDNNKLQLDGPCEEIMSPYPIGDKFAAFKWNVIQCNGHDIEELSDAIDKASQPNGKPTVIIMDTVKGKGVSVFENQIRFHGGRPTEEEYETAFRELDTRIGELDMQIKGLDMRVRELEV